MTTALRSLTRACNIQAGQQDSMFLLHACGRSGCVKMTSGQTVLLLLGAVEAFEIVKCEACGNECVPVDCAWTVLLSAEIHMSKCSTLPWALGVERLWPLQQASQQKGCSSRSFDFCKFFEPFESLSLAGKKHP